VFLSPQPTPSFEPCDHQLCPGPRSQLYSVFSETKRQKPEATSVPVQDNSAVSFEPGATGVPVQDNSAVTLESGANRVPVQHNSSLTFDPRATKVPVRVNSAVTWKPVATKVPVQVDSAVTFAPSSTGVPVQVKSAVTFEPSSTKVPVQVASAVRSAGSSVRPAVMAAQTPQVPSHNKTFTREPTVDLSTWSLYSDLHNSTCSEGQGRSSDVDSPPTPSVSGHGNYTHLDTSPLISEKANGQKPQERRDSTSDLLRRYMLIKEAQARSSQLPSSGEPETESSKVVDQNSVAIDELKPDIDNNNAVTNASLPIIPDLNTCRNNPGPDNKNSWSDILQAGSIDDVSLLANEFSSSFELAELTDDSVDGTF